MINIITNIDSLTEDTVNSSDISIVDQKIYKYKNLEMVDVFHLDEFIDDNEFLCNRIFYDKMAEIFECLDPVFKRSSMHSLILLSSKFFCGNNVGKGDSISCFYRAVALDYLVRDEKKILIDSNELSSSVSRLTSLYRLLSKKGKRTRMKISQFFRGLLFIGNWIIGTALIRLLCKKREIGFIETVFLSYAQDLDGLENRDSYFGQLCSRLSSDGREFRFLFFSPWRNLGFRGLLKNRDLVYLQHFGSWLPKFRLVLVYLRLYWDFFWVQKKLSVDFEVLDEVIFRDSLIGPELASRLCARIDFDEAIRFQNCSRILYAAENNFFEVFIRDSCLRKGCVTLAWYYSVPRVFDLSWIALDFWFNRCSSIKFKKSCTLLNGSDEGVQFLKLRLESSDLDIRFVEDLRYYNVAEYARRSVLGDARDSFDVIGIPNGDLESVEEVLKALLHLHQRNPGFRIAIKLHPGVELDLVLPQESPITLFAGPFDMLPFSRTFVCGDNTTVSSVLNFLGFEVVLVKSSILRSRPITADNREGLSGLKWFDLGDERWLRFSSLEKGCSHPSSLIRRFGNDLKCWMLLFDEDFSK